MEDKIEFKLTMDSNKSPIKFNINKLKASPNLFASIFNTFGTNNLENQFNKANTNNND